MNPLHDEKISGLLDEYSAVAEDLLDLLGKEQAALAGRQLDQIDSVTRKKETLIEKLESLECARQQAESRASEDLQLEMRNLFRERLGSILGNCRDSNLVNGGIIELSRQFNQRLLAILLGNSNGEQELYDKRGENTDHRTNQLFAKI